MTDHKKNLIRSIPAQSSHARKFSFFLLSINNEMYPYTTGRGYKRDRMAILGSLKSKFGKLTIPGSKPGCVTWLSLEW